MGKKQQASKDLDVARQAVKDEFNELIRQAVEIGKVAKRLLVKMQTCKELESK